MECVKYGKSENAVRSRLLEAGKEEFRDRGFLKASLRAICKKQM